MRIKTLFTDMKNLKIDNLSQEKENANLERTINPHDAEIILNLAQR
jgi:hypothetical protein